MRSFRSSLQFFSILCPSLAFGKIALKIGMNFIPYLQPGQRVGFSWLEKILTSNIVCLTLDNKQKSLGFDKRITWLSNDSKISLLPCIVSEL